MKTNKNILLSYLMILCPLYIWAYPFWSPYSYCGGNPVKYTDPTGMVIHMANIKSTDMKYNESTTQSVIDDLMLLTGLTLYLDDNNNLQYIKHGREPVVKQINHNGKYIDAGSNTARKLLINIINEKKVVGVKKDEDHSYTQDDMIRLCDKQINSFIQGAVGIDGNTLGFGMTFLHELHHTSIGGNLNDPDSHNPYEKGEVVNNMNKIRNELNIQGFNYGQRMIYNAIKTNNGSTIIPFNTSALNSLIYGFPMDIHDRYIKYYE